MERSLSIALAGNPNSGKTTMFNALTGARQRVGNYPGVTVTRKEGAVICGDMHVTLVDLPGSYSLTPYAEDEIAARDYLVEGRPDAVIDVVDANTLERGLFLALQLLEMGTPVVLALNMMDEVRKQGDRIDSGRLSKLLGIPVVETVARNGDGKTELVRQAVEFARQSQGRINPLFISYGPEIDEALQAMAGPIERSGILPHLPPRWLAVKYLEGDDGVREAFSQAEGGIRTWLAEQAESLEQHVRLTLGSDLDAVMADHRHGFIASLLRQGVVIRDEVAGRRRFTDAADRVLTHRLLGPAIMLGVLYAMFQLTFMISEAPMGWLESLFGWISEGVESALPDGLLRSLIVSGIIDGVGGILGFLPLILTMFVLLSFLEDSGYTARMAYMLDRVFKAFGLHGSSVMPFIISGGVPGGCAVPGVMAARTIKSPRERLATILTAPFMACGAKVPVILLLTAAFFPDTGAGVLFGITLFSWAAALLAAKILRTTVMRGEPTPFIMELPPYRLPTLRGVAIHALERAWGYVKKAGSVILAISILLWAAMTFPGLPEEKTAQFEAMRMEASAMLSGEDADARLAEIDNAEAEEALKHSAAGRVGLLLEPVSRMIGFDWRVNIALVGGFAAKEVVVSTLGTAYSLGDVDPEESEGLSERLASDPSFSKATALSLLVFIILYAPCFVTVVVMAKEASWKWAAFSVVFNTGLAFVTSAVVYNLAIAF